MSSSSRVTLTGVQFLRFVAAGGVVAFHAFEFAARDVAPLPERLLGMTNLGAVGVHIFFVISGFIMVWTTRDKFGAARNISSFLIRRAVRVFPVYWVLALINLPVLLGYGLGGPDTALALLRSLFLWPSESSNLIFVGWTLSYELFFYLLFAGVIAFRARQAVALLSAVILFLVGVGLVLAPTGDGLALATNVLLVEFLAGAVIGLFFMEGFRLPPALAWTGIAGGSAMIFATGFLDAARLPLVAVWGVPSAMIVGGTVALDMERRFPRSLARLARLGDSSYALYLVHAMMLPPLTMLLGRHTETGVLGSIAMACVLAVLCVAVGHLVHRTIERPLIAWCRPEALAARFRPRPAVAPV